MPFQLFSTDFRTISFIGEKVGTASNGREAMAAFPAARREDFPPACCLHARAEAVFLVATAHSWLIGAFRQSVLPLAELLARIEFDSVVEGSERVKKARCRVVS